MGETRARATQGALVIESRGASLPPVPVPRGNGRQTPARDCTPMKSKNLAFARGRGGSAAGAIRGRHRPPDVLNRAGGLRAAQGLLPALRSAVRGLAASKGSQWSQHGARVYFGEAFYSETGFANIVECAARSFKSRRRKERAARARRKKGYAPSAPSRHWDDARSLPLEHPPSGARRYAGSQATLASLFRSKVCYYAPFAMPPLEGNDAPPLHPSLVPLAMASITSSVGLKRCAEATVRRE